MIMLSANGYHVIKYILPKNLTSLQSPIVQNFRGVLEGEILVPESTHVARRTTTMRRRRSSNLIVLPQHTLLLLNS
jgi:hypothetical protein